MNSSLSPQTSPSQNSPVAPTSWMQIPQMPWAQNDDLDLKHLLTILKRRIWVVTGVGVGVMAAVCGTALLQEPVYEGNFRVLVEPVNAENDVPDLALALGDQVAQQSGLDYETQVQVLRSPDLLQPVIEDLQDTYPELDYSSLLEDLTILQLGETKILEVRYQDADTVKIQRVLDELAQAYLAYSLDERQTNLRQGIQFIDQQLPELESQVSQLQLDLEQFRRLNNFLDPETQTQQVANQAQQIQERQLELDQQLAQTQTRSQQLTTEQGGQAAIKDAQVYQSLVQELRAVETEIAAALTRFQPNSLNVRVLQEKRDNLLPLIDLEGQRVVETEIADANSQLQLLRSQNQALSQTSSQLQQILENLPGLSREYSNLQRELQIATEALNRFLVSRETLQIDAAQTEIPWQLIEAPQQPEQPISPNLQRTLVLGVVSSLLLGVGAALLVEKLDPVYRTVDDLKASVKLPLLGTLPLQTELVKANAQPSLFQRLRSRIGPSTDTAVPVSNGYGSSHLLESLRVLHTNLQLLSSDRPIRSVIISSAMPGDGKSTVAVHLAKTAATLGKRVLLVEADMRRPGSYEKLGIPNTKGLSDLIAGSLSTADVIQPALPFTEFYAITAGRIPPDPVKLLASQRMQQLVKEFEREFDLIIYDSPPLIGLADASVLAPHTDGLIFVARINQTERNLLKLALDSLKLTQTPVLGLVVNGVSAQSADGYKYYSYSYPTPPPQPDSRIGSNAEGQLSGIAVLGDRAKRNGHTLTSGHCPDANRLSEK